MASKGEVLWESLAGTGASDEVIAARLGVSKATVNRWRRQRFVSKSAAYEARIWAAVNVLGDAPRVEDARQLRADLRQALSSASVMLRRLATLTPDDVLAVVIAALSRADFHVRLTVAPAYRGTVSHDLRTPLHYLVGVDVLNDAPPADQRLPKVDVVNIVRMTLQSEWQDLGIHFRVGSAPEWPPDQQPAVVLQIPVVERPRPTPSDGPLDVPGLGRQLLVLAPTYGYGELLAALLAEALGMGLADLRYQEEPPTATVDGDDKPLKTVLKAAREARYRRGRHLLAGDANGLAWCVAGGQLLQDLRKDIVNSLPTTTVVAVEYGRKWSERGRAVHQTPQRDQAANGQAATKLALQASRTSPSTIFVSYVDADVVKTPRADTADVDLIADATVLTAIEILDGLQVDPQRWRDGWLASLRDERRLEDMRERIRRRETSVVIPKT